MNPSRAAPLQRLAMESFMGALGRPLVEHVHDACLEGRLEALVTIAVDDEGEAEHGAVRVELEQRSAERLFSLAVDVPDFKRDTIKAKASLLGDLARRCWTAPGSKAPLVKSAIVKRDPEETLAGELPEVARDILARSGLAGLFLTGLGLPKPLADHLPCRYHAALVRGCGAACLSRLDTWLKQRGLRMAVRCGEAAPCGLERNEP